MLKNIPQLRSEIHDANNKLFIVMMQLEQAEKYNDQKTIEDLSFRKDLIETQIEALRLVLDFQNGENI